MRETPPPKQTCTCSPSSLVNHPLRLISFFGGAQTPDWRTVDWTNGTVNKGI